MVGYGVRPRYEWGPFKIRVQNATLTVARDAQPFPGKLQPHPVHSAVAAPPAAAIFSRALPEKA